MRTLALLWFLAGLSLGQSAPRPRFDVAAVRMYPAGAVVAPGAQGFEQSRDGLRATHVTLRGCLQWAYGIADVEGPDWITNESYDITAKAAAPVLGAEMNQMMQTLLEERFKLRVRREMKDSLVGVLGVGKSGVKNLRAVEHPGQPEIRREDGRLYLKNATMRFVASVMASPLGRMPLETVVNDTGLEGQFDLTLDFNDFNPSDPQFRDYREMRDALLDFASRALDKSYGLKIERRKLPIEFLVVEGGNKVPTEN